MSYSCLVLGESGTGKTCSLRNLDPSKTLLIQPTRKPLPFRATGWKEAAEKGDGGNIFVSDDPVRILHVMHKAPHDIIVIDDWQYVLCNIFMARANDKGYEKFTQIGKAGFDILKAASELAPNKRVYVLAHTHTGDDGRENARRQGRARGDVYNRPSHVLRRRQILFLDPKQRVGHREKSSRAFRFKRYRQ